MCVCVYVCLKILINEIFYSGENNDKVIALKNSIPFLKELFHIHKKVGEGTFSSVYLATLKSSNGSKKYALKHLVPTCHIEKIERELQCLKQIG